MGLIYWGEVDAASDITMAEHVNTSGTSTRASIVALITPVAAGIIAGNPSIIAAASAAVGNALATSNVLTADLAAAATRSTRSAVSMSFQDSSFGVRYPSVYPSVYPAGVWSTPVARRADLATLGPDGKLPVEALPDKPIGVLPNLVVQSVPGGPIDLEVRDGITWIRSAVIANGGAVGGSVKRVYTIAVLGQSNDESFAHPVVPFLDHETPRIWQLPYGGTALVPAAVPLTGPAFGSGLSPAHVLARRLIERDPECVVVLVPAAVGGSGLVTDPVGGRGKWAVGYTGPNPPLNANAIEMTTRANTQILARWGVAPTVFATIVLGETDGAEGTTRAAFQSALDTLIADWQTRFSATVFIAGIVPGYEPAGTRPEIILALQDTPRRVRRVAYFPGVENGGGSRGPTDPNHYTREAVVEIGDGWYEAIPRAFNNVVGSSTQKPLKVSATRWGGTVTATWSPVQCLVTAYEVQSSPDGTTWTTVPMIEPVATRVEFASAVPVKVRVRAIGTETSDWTTPVIAIGG